MGRVFEYGCPRRLHDRGAREVVRLWAMLRAYGVLPDAGGVLDQSAWLLDAFEHCDRVADDRRDDEG